MDIPSWFYKMKLVQLVLQVIFRIKIKFQEPEARKSSRTVWHNQLSTSLIVTSLFAFELKIQRPGNLVRTQHIENTESKTNMRECNKKILFFLRH